MRPGMAAARSPLPRAAAAAATPPRPPRAAAAPLHLLLQLGLAFGVAASPEAGACHRGGEPAACASQAPLAAAAAAAADAAGDDDGANGVFLVQRSLLAPRAVAERLRDTDAAWAPAWGEAGLAAGGAARAPPEVAVRGGPFAERKHCYRVPGQQGKVKCYPEIFMAGASKCGSTSIAAYLLAHPHVVMQTADGGKSSFSVNTTVPGFSATKNVFWETHLFDWHTEEPKSRIWRNWFSEPAIPTADAGQYLQMVYTPHQVYHPDVPFHVLETYPNAKSMKYIVILREPTTRAVSAWRFHRQVIGEMRSFRRVVDDGLSERRALERCYEGLKGGGPPRVIYELPKEEMRAAIDTCIWGRQDTHDTTTPAKFVGGLLHAHVDKGIYVDQLRRWFTLIGKDKFFVFSLEEWVQDNMGWYKKLADFVGIEAIGPNGFSSAEELKNVLSVEYNEGVDVSLGLPKPPEPDRALKKELAEFYRPHDEALFELLGRRLWETPSF